VFSSGLHRHREIGYKSLYQLQLTLKHKTHLVSDAEQNLGAYPKTDH